MCPQGAGGGGQGWYCAGACPAVFLEALLQPFWGEVETNTDDNDWDNGAYVMQIRTIVWTDVCI